jgi:hypothetical protein
VSTPERFQWPTTADDIPPGADVVLGFHGLMCFCHRHGRDNKCEIGVHNGSPVHQLSITVYAVAQGFDPPHQMDMRPFFKVAGPFGTAETGDKVEFEVEEPRLSRVSYFQRGGPRDDPRNFRLILDLEDDFYKGVQLKKRKNLFGPRIRVEHALLYTLCASRATFSRVEVTSPPGNGNPTPLGRVSRLVGANFYVESRGSVTMKLKNAPGVVMRPSDGKFFVLIDNGCAGCEDNDFHRYYDTFEQPAGTPRFDVIRDHTTPPTPAPGTPCALIERTVKDRGTDDSPCGAAGFGASDEIPPT